MEAELLMMRGEGGLVFGRSFFLRLSFCRMFVAFFSLLRSIDPRPGGSGAQPLDSHLVFVLFL